MIWAHGYDGGSSSGNAFAIPNDSFVVTLGLWSGGGDSRTPRSARSSTSSGHDLGLCHGGDGAGENYKPNYLSVMNYRFQVSGVPRTSGTNTFGYSWFTAPALNESALNEDVGIDVSQANTFRTIWSCPSGGTMISPGTAHGPLDWSCGGFVGGTVAADLNGDGVLSNLLGYNNYANLTFGGGAVGGGVSGLTALSRSKSPVVPEELSFEVAKKHGFIR